LDRSAFNYVVHFPSLLVSHPRGQFLFSPLDGFGSFILDGDPCRRATITTPSSVPLVQFHERKFTDFRMKPDPFDWDFADRRLMEMICAAVLAGRMFSIPAIKFKHELHDDHGTWDDANWHLVAQELIEC
jgi:hypothetical protein